MSKETPSYTVNMSRQSLIDIYVRQWVLRWCKKHHPEAFEEAEEYVKKFIEEREK